MLDVSARAPVNKSVHTDSSSAINWSTTRARRAYTPALVCPGPACPSVLRPPPPGREEPFGPLKEPLKEPLPVTAAVHAFWRISEISARTWRITSGHTLGTPIPPPLVPCGRCRGCPYRLNKKMITKNEVQCELRWQVIGR